MRTIRNISIMLLLFIGATAAARGYLLVNAPNSPSLQLPLSWMQNSSFHHYFIPGLLLVFINGLMSLIALMAVIFKWSHYNRFVLLEGTIIIVWILFQMILMNQMFWQQFVYLIAGDALIIISLMLRTDYSQMLFNQESEGQRV